MGLHGQTHLSASRRAVRGEELPLLVTVFHYGDTAVSADVTVELPAGLELVEGAETSTLTAREPGARSLREASRRIGALG